MRENELKEAITHIAFYAGWPRSMSAMSVAKQVFGGCGRDRTRRPRYQRTAGCADSVVDAVRAHDEVNEVAHELGLERFCRPPIHLAHDLCGEP